MALFDYLKEVLFGDTQEIRPEHSSQKVPEHHLDARFLNDHSYDRTFGSIGTEDASPLEFLEHANHD